MIPVPSPTIHIASSDQEVLYELGTTIIFNLPDGAALGQRTT
jgi:hypothetical protein